MGSHRLPTANMRCSVGSASTSPFAKRAEFAAH
jgi:hypothetical protein